MSDREIDRKARELVARVIAGMSVEIVQLVADRLNAALLELKRTPVESASELHTDLMVTPDKKHQH